MNYIFDLIYHAWNSMANWERERETENMYVYMNESTWKLEMELRFRFVFEFRRVEAFIWEGNKSPCEIFVGFNIRSKSNLCIVEYEHDF